MKPQVLSSLPEVTELVGGRSGRTLEIPLFQNITCESVIGYFLSIKDIFSF